LAQAVDAAAMKDALVVLGAASLVVPLGRRLGINPILSFLAAGVLLGPHGVGALESTVPLVGWITIAEKETLDAIAELGVVFLLFVIGLELSLARLMTMRRLVFGLGLVQVLASAAAIFAVASFFLPPSASLVLGLGIALSSTAIVIELLAADRRVSSATGRASFAILLFQDLAVVPILFLVGALGASGGGSVLEGLAAALVQALLTIAAIVACGHFLLRPLFRLVAGPANPELFMAATLLVAIGTGVASAAAGLSMALGAFIAGLLLAETEYRRAIEATIDPFKSLLLGVFFFAVGTSLDLALVFAHWQVVAGTLLAIIVVKAAIVYVSARLFRLSRAVATEIAFLLAPAGEFAFVVFAVAAANGVLAGDQPALAVATASLSMALIPLLGAIGRRLGRLMEPPAPIDPEASVAPPEDRAHRAIVVGYGRVGRLVCEMLERHGVPYLAVDADARSVARWRRTSKHVYWGDATNIAFLERCGLADASALVITIDQPKHIEAIVTAVKQSRPDLVIVARSRDAGHARALYALGVADAVPETIEASLQLSEAALVGLGVATGPVIASIHERRDEFRDELQAAAGRETRAVQPKRRFSAARRPGGGSGPTSAAR
jgi:monovalent cation:H+ antiporter-2, CPA2 family